VFVSMLGTVYLLWLNAFARVGGAWSFGDVNTPASSVVDPDITGPDTMDVFEVSVPLRKNFGGTSCEQVVVKHVFAASYGSPYVGREPPIHHLLYQSQ